MSSDKDGWALLRAGAIKLSRRATITGAAAIAAEYPHLVDSPHWPIIVELDAIGSPMSFPPLSASFRPPCMSRRDWVEAVVRREWRDGNTHRELIERLTDHDELRNWYARIPDLIPRYLQDVASRFEEMVPELTLENAIEHFQEGHQFSPTILQPLS